MRKRIETVMKRSIKVLPTYHLGFDQSFDVIVEDRFVDSQD